MLSFWLSNELEGDLTMRMLFILGFLLLFASVSAAADSALVAAAKKEKERREKVAATKTITNKEVEEFVDKKKAAGEYPVDTQEPDPGSEVEASEPISIFAVPAASQAKPEFRRQPVTSSMIQDGEAYWRGRKQALESRIADLQRQIDEVWKEIHEKEAIMDTSTYHYFTDEHGNQIGLRRDPRAPIANNEVLALNERLASLQDQVKETKRQLEEDLPEEARKAGALPGWLRD